MTFEKKKTQKIGMYDKTEVEGAAGVDAAIMPEVADEISVDHMTRSANEALTEGVLESCTGRCVRWGVCGRDACPKSIPNLARQRTQCKVRNGVNCGKKKQPRFRPLDPPQWSIDNPTSLSISLSAVIDLCH